MTADEPIVRKHLIFYGTVQGVGFRRRALRAAEEAECTGWVRNNRIGTVSMEIQGSEARIDRVIRFIKRSQRISITELKSRYVPVEEGESAFVIKRRKKVSNSNALNQSGGTEHESS